LKLLVSGGALARSHLNRNVTYRRLMAGSIVMITLSAKVCA